MKQRSFSFWCFGVFFWLCFYLAYPWRELIDDVRYQAILENKSFYFSYPLFRPVHSLLLYLQGFFLESSMEKAVLISIVLHLITVSIAWKILIPRLPAKIQLPAFLGLFAFLFHPVSLQTAVHISQRAEILGTLFMTLSICVFLNANRPRPSITSFVQLAGLTLLCFFSKENFGLVALLLLFVLAIQTKSGVGTLLSIGCLGLIFYCSQLNAISQPLVQNQDNYRKSREFHQAVLEGRETTKENSLILPLRDRQENLQLQTALIPLIARIIVIPFGLVNDYGHFPYGRASYQLTLPWLWLGSGLLLSLLGLGVFFWKKLNLGNWALLVSPAVLYGVYWIFPVYDPLVLYRLYGVVFLLFVVAIPIALQNFQYLTSIFAILLAVSFLGGSVRAYEMKNPLREAETELSRRPENFRIHIARLHSLLKNGIRPIDCQKELEPALKLTPSTSLIYIEWAYCLIEQGQKNEAKIYAKKSLEQEAVPENISIALQYLMGPTGLEVPLTEIHPENLKYIVNK